MNDRMNAIEAKVKELEARIVELEPKVETVHKYVKKQKKAQK